MIFRMPPPAFCPKVLPRWTKRAILWTQAPHKVRPREVAAIEIFWIFLISFAVVGLLVCVFLLAMRQESWRGALLLAAVVIAFLLALMNATALTDNLRSKPLLAWCCFLPALLGLGAYYTLPDHRKVSYALVILSVALNLLFAFF